MVSNEKTNLSKVKKFVKWLCIKLSQLFHRYDTNSIKSNSVCFLISRNGYFRFLAKIGLELKSFMPIKCLRYGAMPLVHTRWHKKLHWL